MGRTTRRSCVSSSIFSPICKSPRRRPPRPLPLANVDNGLAGATHLAVVEAAVQAAVADYVIARHALAYNAAVDLVLAGNTINY